MRFVDWDTKADGNCFDGLKGRAFLALVAESDRDRIPVLQADARSAGVRLGGAFFPELIVGVDLVQRGAWLLPLPDSSEPCLIEGLAGDVEEAAPRLISSCGALLEGFSDIGLEPTLYLLFDGMLPHIGSLVHRLGDRFDGAALAGGNAGSGTFTPMPCVFDEHRLVQGGALAFVLPHDQVTVLDHGFDELVAAIGATVSQGNRVTRINAEPAFRGYQTLLRKQFGLEVTRESFYSMALRYPFGVMVGAAEMVVRIPVAIDPVEALVCVGEIPPESPLVILRSPEADGGRCIERIAQRLMMENEGRALNGLVTLYCAGRKSFLGGKVQEELTRLVGLLHPSEHAGALSLGEIGRTSASATAGFHNATMVCTPWR